MAWLRLNNRDQRLENREQARSYVSRVLILRPWAWNHATAVLAGSALLLLAGCRQDMHNQPKMIPRRGSEFFADGRGARPQVENTVARGQLHEDSYFYTGVVQGANGYKEEKDLIPFPVPFLAW